MLLNVFSGGVDPAEAGPLGASPRESDSGVADLSNTSLPSAGGGVQQTEELAGVHDSDYHGDDETSQLTGNEPSQDDCEAVDQVKELPPLSVEALQETAAEGGGGSGAVVPQSKTAERLNARPDVAPQQATDDDGSSTNPRANVFVPPSRPNSRRLNDLAAEVSEKKEELVKLQGDYRGVTGEKESLEQELKTAKDEMERMEKRSASEVEQLKQEKAKEIDSLKNEVREKDKGLEHLGERISQAEIELNKSKEEVEQLESQLKRAKLRAKASDAEAVRVKKEAAETQLRAKERLVEQEVSLRQKAEETAAQKCLELEKEREARESERKEHENERKKEREARESERKEHENTKRERDVVFVLLLVVLFLLILLVILFILLVVLILLVILFILLVVVFVNRHIVVRFS